MRVVLSADGSRGDLQPMIELGARLRAAGHDALVCGPPDFAAQAASRAVAYHGLGDSFQAFLADHASVIDQDPLRVMREGIRYARQRLAGRLEALFELTRGADLVVAGGADLAASTAAERNRVAYRYVGYCPALFPSRDHAPAFLPWQGLPPLVNRCLWPLVMRPVAFAFGRVLDPVRARVGLARPRDLLAHLFGARPLLAVDARLASAQRDCPWPLEQVAALHPLDPEPLSAKLEAFLAAGPSPIYVGFGSMPDSDPIETTRRIVEAAERAGVRAVLSAGWAGLAQGALPETVFAVDAVSHPALFPRCAAIVHHGGAGTTTTAARAGVAQILAPHVMDQFYWARRVRVLGLGLSLSRRFGVAELARALEAVVDNEALAERARELGASLRADARACDPVRPLLSAF